MCEYDQLEDRVALYEKENAKAERVRKAMQDYEDQLAQKNMNNNNSRTS